MLFRRYINLRRFGREDPKRAVGAQAAASLGESGSGHEFLECLNWVGIPRSQGVHGEAYRFE